MEEWKTYRLGEVLLPKGYIRGPFGSALVRSELKESGVPVYEQQHAIYNHRDFRFFIDDVKYDELKRFTVQTNDLIISCSGTVGFVSIIRESDPKGIISQALLALRVNPNIILPQYLMYFLKSEVGHNSIISRSSGSVQVNIAKRDVIESIPLHLPSIEIQRKIVDVLVSIDDKIELNNQINHNLEEQAQALYKSWFVDFEPFELDIEGVPIGWKNISLSEIMSYNGGSQPPASEFIEEYKEGYIRFVQIRDYASNSHITYIPISSRNKICSKRDIMIARYGASLGRICFGLEGAYNVALAKVSPKKHFYREFLRCYLTDESFYESINMKGNRAVQAGFNQSDIESYNVCFPQDDSILEHFESVCSSLFEKRLQIIEQNTHLQNIRDSLLPKLMSGELSVNSIDC